MLFLLLLSCALHKTSLVGIVDSIDNDSCIIELSSGNIISIESRLCNHIQEGEQVLFYMKPPAQDSFSTRKAVIKNK